MHAVVNTMTLAHPVPPEVFERMRTELMSDAKRIPGFHDGWCVTFGDRSMTMVVLCETEEALQRVHDEVGNPWVSANLRPYVQAFDRRAGVVAAHAGTAGP